MGEAFYEVAKLPPPKGVCVRIIWGAHTPFEATRIDAAWLRSRRIKLRRKVSDSEELWFVRDENGELIVLPDPRAPRTADQMPWEGWHTLKDGPQFWAPLRADRYQGQLPDVALMLVAEPPIEPRKAGTMTFEEYRDKWQATVNGVVSGGPKAFQRTRFASERQSYSAADAAQAAEEMEADRRAAASSRDFDPEEQTSRLSWQWWRDHSLVRYEPQEALTLRQAEARLMRALAISSPFYGSPSLTTDISSAMRALSEQEEDWLRQEADNPLDDMPVRLEPTVADHGDFLTAMGWYVALNQTPNFSFLAWVLSDEQKVLAWRAAPLPFSYREIGERLRLKKSRAHQIFTEAIEKAWRIGAGLAAPVGDRLIERLREDNKRFKRTRGETV